MHRFDDHIRFSAADLCGFFDCPHLTSLELINLENPLETDDADVEHQLMADKGLEHEQDYLALLQDQNKSTVSASATCQFRGSFTHPMQPLSTLRTPRYDDRPQDSLPAWPLRSGWTGLSPAR